MTKEYKHESGPLRIEGALEEIRNDIKAGDRVVIITQRDRGLAQAQANYAARRRYEVQGFHVTKYPTENGLDLVYHLVLSRKRKPIKKAVAALFA